jgi:uncharacterized protein
MAPRTDPRLSAFVTDHLPAIVQRFAPERVIAFGSRVSGEPHLHSDLDLIVVAESFRDVHWLDRSVAVLDAIGAPFAMDVLCYTPGEFARKLDEIGIVRTAVETGVELHAA